MQICVCVPAKGVGIQERERETLFLMPPLGLLARRPVKADSTQGTQNVLARNLSKVLEMLKDI